MVVNQEVDMYNCTIPYKKLEEILIKTYENFRHNKVYIEGFDKETEEDLLYMEHFYVYRKKNPDEKYLGKDIYKEIVGDDFKAIEYTSDDYDYLFFTCRKGDNIETYSLNLEEFNKYISLKDKTNLRINMFCIENSKENILAHEYGILPSETLVNEEALEYYGVNAFNKKEKTI